MIEVPAFSQKLEFYERAMAAALADPNPDNTLFAQLTQAEMTLITVGLFLVGKFYGDELVDPTRDKFIALMETQGFHYRPTGGETP